MKKITAIAVLSVAALALASPAHADNGDNFGRGVNPANIWNLTAAAVCLQEVGIVPVLGNRVGDHANNCFSGNVIDQAGKALAPLR
ncbi:hypothetical protein AB0O76_01375 [Streptomyces sp. NPDC086554]|uniref:hypothetical protein n=1 Tax=Streptomyces sp. NPDC086554 TaxID=3154864 RepID=UPI00341381D9